MATLVRVYPEQVNSIWALVREAIISTTRTPTERKINEILEKIMIRTFQCWSVVEEDELYAIALTSIIGEKYTDKHLMLHTFYIFKKLVGAQYVELWEQFKKLAQAHECEDIIFYTSNDKLCEFIVDHGGFVDKFVSIPV